MKKNISNHTGGYLGAFLSGLFFSLIFLAVLLCLAFLYHADLMQQGREGLFLRIALTFTALMSALISGKRALNKKLLYSAVSLSVFALLLVFIGVFTNNSSIINISFLYNILAVISGGFVGGMLSAKANNRHKR